MSKKEFIYFRIDVKTLDRLKSAQEFARTLKFSGKELDDWLFSQIEKYKRESKYDLTEGFLTPTGVIRMAKKEFALDITMADLQYWREKKKLPKLREKFDYIYGAGQKRGRILYRRDKMPKFFKVLRAHKEHKALLKEKREIFAEGQEWTADAGGFTRKRTKVINANQRIVPIAGNIEE